MASTYSDENMSDSLCNMYVSAYLHPQKSTFEKIKSYSDSHWKSGLRGLLISLFIGSLGRYISGEIYSLIFKPEHNLARFGTFESINSFPFAFLNILLLGSIHLIAVLVGTTISHRFSERLGIKRPFSQILFCLTVIISPLVILVGFLSSIPWLFLFVVLFVLYGLILMTIAIKAVYGFDWLSAVAFMLPILTFLAFEIAYLLIAFIENFMNIM